MAAGDYAGTMVVLISSPLPIVAVFEAFEIVPPPTPIKTFEAELPQLDREGRIALAKLLGRYKEPEDTNGPLPNAG